MKNQREIKFRAWDKINNQWWSDGFTISEDGKIMLLDNDNKYVEMENQDDYVLFQYTGLKDSKGVEIYEGDILDITSNNSAGNIMPNKYEVRYFCDGFKLVLKGYEEDIYNNLGEMPNGNTEVIGNIYQNPEKLK